MHKRMHAATSGVVVLVAAGLAAGCGQEVADAVANAQVANAQVVGVEPCDTSVSGAPSMLCGKSTDAATWWNAAGITASRRGDGWHTQPTFFPPDVAYSRWALPEGDEEFAVLSGQRIKGYIDDVTAISRKSRDDGHQYWGRLTGSDYDHMTTDYVAEQFRRVGLEQVRLQTFDLPPQWWPTSWEVSVTGGGKSVTLESAWPHASHGLGAKGTEGRTLDLEPIWVGLGTPGGLRRTRRSR